MDRPPLHSSRARVCARGAVASIVLSLFACGDRNAVPEVPGARLRIEWLVVGNERITAEIAEQDRDRRHGLMYRESMPEDHGMLFLFSNEVVRSFWMKNTLLPLSIAYADSSGRIVHIADMEPQSERLVSSQRPARYALEMNQGWFERHGVFAGDEIRRIPRRDGP